MLRYVLRGERIETPLRHDGNSDFSPSFDSCFDFPAASVSLSPLRRYHDAATPALLFTDLSHHLAAFVRGV